MEGAMQGLLKRLLMLQMRKRRRFRAPRGICVVMGGQAVPGQNQVYDISMGGLSFFFVDNGLPVAHHHKTLTISQNGRPAAAQIPCEIVDDLDTGELIFPKQQVKRRCVKFQRLNPQQRDKIRALIKSM